jgi:2',3'-cyclic-nucleotide 2'-phosphodiesterase (5'-nucleotidase family)
MPVGGPALIGQALAEARAEPYPVLVADAGDFVSEGTDPLNDDIALFMVEVFERLGFDAVGLGELELVRDSTFLDAAASRLKLVSGNIRFPEAYAVRIPTLRYASAGSLTVAFTAYIDPALVPTDSTGIPVTIEDPVTALTPLIEEARRHAHRVVVLAHAGRPQIEEFLAASPPVDVVVLGHLPRGHDKVEMIGDTFLVEPWRLSRHIHLLTLDKKAGETDLTANFRTWILQFLESSDSTLAAMVDTFETRHGLSH